MAISLRYKLLAIMATLLASAILAYLLWAVQLFNDDKRAYVYESNAALVQALAAETETGLESVVKSMRLVGESLSAQPPPGRAEADLVAAVIRNDPDIVELTSYAVDHPQTPLLDLYNPGYLKPFGLDRSYLERVRQQKPVPFELVRSRPIHFQNSSLPGGAPLLTAAVAVEHPAGPPTIVVAQLRLDRRLQTFANQTSPKTYLMDAVGNLLVHPDVKRILRGESLAAVPYVQDIIASSVATGAKEYPTSDGPLIVAFSKLRLGNLVVVSEIPKAKAFLASRILIERSVLFALLLILVSFIVSLIFTKRLTRALRKLYLATKRIGQGDFSTEVAVDTRDEIGALSIAFNRMSRKITRLLAETAAKARMESELETAQLVQENFFPDSELDAGTVEIASYYLPASECGGDWFGYRRIRDELVIMIGDATGHGVPAALITAAAQSCCTTVAHMYARTPSLHLEPRAIMDMLNTAVTAAGRGKVKMTFFVAVINLITGDVAYTNAAHDMPLVGRSPRSEDERPQLETMSGKPDPCLGGDPHTVYRSHEFRLAPGDVVVWYTDGLVECKNTDDVEYGEPRLTRAFARLVPLPAATIREQLLAGAFKHYGERPRDDDIAMVVVKMKELMSHTTLAS